MTAKPNVQFAQAFRDFEPILYIDNDHPNEWVAYLPQEKTWWIVPAVEGGWDKRKAIHPSQSFVDALEAVAGWHGRNLGLPT